MSEANNRASNSGRYAYKTVLGEGNFGSVLKATDKSTDKDVAVKIIKIKKSFLEKIMFFKTPASLKQGRKEALILTHLQQENIIVIRDHFKLQKICLLAVRASERTTEEGRLSWFKQLASAIAFIHP